jgi:hypothetical protein
LDEDWRTLGFGRALRAYVHRTDAAPPAQEDIRRWAREVIRHGPPDHAVEGVPDTFVDWVPGTSAVFVVFTVVAYEQLVVVLTIY